MYTGERMVRLMAASRADSSGGISLPRTVRLGREHSASTWVQPSAMAERKGTDSKQAASTRRWPLQASERGGGDGGLEGHVVVVNVVEVGGWEAGGWQTDGTAPPLQNAASQPCSKRVP